MSDWEERLVEQRSAVRLLFDENLPPSLKKSLADLFPSSVHVKDLDLASSPGAAIWDYAKAFNFAILTKDGDFGKRVRAEGPPPTVIQVRAGNCSVSRLVTLIRENATTITTTVQFGGALLDIGFEREGSASTEQPTE